MGTLAARYFFLMSSETASTSTVIWRDVPKSVWALGFVSLLMDVSSELVHSLLPIFLFTVVGASTTIVGLIEGVAEATAAVAKVFEALVRVEVELDALRPAAAAKPRLQAGRAMP